MSDIDNFPLPPQPPLRQPPVGGRSASSPWPRALAIVGVLACGVALGVGGVAAATAMDQMGFAHGVRLAFVQRAVARALDSVGVSSAQEAKVHDIVAARFAEIAPKPEEHAALRKQALDLLGAPTVDRAAVEKLRLDVVAKFDAKTKAIVGGLEDIADQLTPAQRAQLSAELAKMDGHGPMMGPWGEGRRHHHRMDRDSEDSPDNGSDKD